MGSTSSCGIEKAATATTKKNKSTLKGKADRRNEIAISATVQHRSLD